MDKLPSPPVMHGSNPPAVQLARKLAEMAPRDLDTVKLLSGGSELTEAAIKMARQNHKLTGKATKFKVISRYRSWHGSTMGSLSASGQRTVGSWVHIPEETERRRCPRGKGW